MIHLTGSRTSKHRASQNWQQRPVYQVTPAPADSGANSVPARPDPRVYSDHPHLPGLQRPPDLRAIASMQPGYRVNQIVGPSQGWTETGYKPVPQEEKLREGWSPRQIRETRRYRGNTTVCTVFNTPIEENLQVEPAPIFLSSGRSPRYAGKRGGYRKVFSPTTSLALITPRIVKPCGG
ncbi:hypothetical protein M0R45_008490 [Rubus argutus]|uniref:Uncharacterized protein n=1 Tax=Rubus argutus TaxID=59490 RepID=A0AAW1Y534_RUBAR